MSALLFKTLSSCRSESPPEVPKTLLKALLMLLGIWDMKASQHLSLASSSSQAESGAPVLLATCVSATSSALSHPIGLRTQKLGRKGGKRGPGCRGAIMPQRSNPERKALAAN